jgi:hypothetical protein
MKRTLNLLSVVAVLAMTGAALAGGEGGSCSGGPANEVVKTAYSGEVASTALAAVRIRYCCLKSAEIGAPCCGKSAGEVKAQYDLMRAADRTLASMHPCCVAALKTGVGCCGKDAASLQSSFAAQFGDARAQLTALDALRPCCAAAVEAHKGCCGKDATTLSADFARQVVEARTRLLNLAEGC